MPNGSGTGLRGLSMSVVSIAIWGCDDPLPASISPSKFLEHSWRPQAV